MSISVQGISKSFKGRRKGEPENEVLKDVNFEVGRRAVRILARTFGMREDDYAYNHCGVSEGNGRSHKGQWRRSGKTGAGQGVYVPELCLVPMA